MYSISVDRLMDIHILFQKTTKRRLYIIGWNEIANNK